MDQELVEASNDILLFGAKRFADHAPDGVIRDFGTVIAGAGGVPVPAFNRVLVTEQPSAEDFATAVDWIVDREVPFWVTATDSTRPAVAELATDFDLELADDAPGMARELDEDLSDSTSVAEIARVTDETGLGAFLTVFAAAFELPREHAETVTPPSILADEAIEAFVGRVDGEPVASGLLVRTDDVAGVYNIGVREGYRRQGIGEAMIRAVLRAGLDAGCRVGVLQSSEMAVPLYEDLGFETVVTYHHFAPAT